MDKKSILGFVLIGLILIGWLVWSSNSQKKQISNLPPKTDSVVSNTTTTTSQSDSLKNLVTDKNQIHSDSLQNNFGAIFKRNVIGYKDSSVNNLGEKNIIIENDKVRYEFTNYGGTVREYIIKDFMTWDNNPVQLINWEKGKELHLIFTSKDGKLINTKDLYFESSYTPDQKINLKENQDFKLKYVLNVSNDTTERIIKTYSFKPDSYEFDVDYELVNSDKFISGNKYQVLWSSSLNLTEQRSDQEASYSEGFAYMGGELETVDATDFNEEYKADFNGTTDYVCSRNKYFGVFLIPVGRKGDGVYITGNKIPLKDNGVKEEYSIAIKMDIKNEQYEKSSFEILVTPLDYDILKSYGQDLQKVLRFSLDFIVRPIAQYVLLPVFKFLHSFIPNYGVVIILFALILKVLLNPLTKKQTESMKRMSELNPKITAIREKHKDDPMKANEQIMRLYKEEKINPAGGCLPLLLQLPILYALFGLFNSTIELRQQSFLWIKDLSSPDVIFTLPFKIPLFGINEVSLLALLVGITMFIQQKMTMKDPKQAAMVYIMPIMLTLLFFSFPAGLNLYYLTFNILSLIQQVYTNKKGSEENSTSKNSSNKLNGSGSSFSKKLPQKVK